MDKGIVLLALGSPLYGQMAFNLAMSIKTEEPNFKIALFYSNSAISTLKKWHLPFFDMFYCVDESDYMVDNKPQYQLCKLRVYDYSPFEQTIYMDVDAIWCPNRKVSWLMGELADHDFTIGCGSYVDIRTRAYKRKYQLWGDFNKIIEYHGLTDGKLWETWSAFIYFKKNDKIKTMFDEARSIYYDKEVPCPVWAGGKPDEYCINVAMNKTNLHPHEENYVPVYCSFIGGSRDEETIKKKFWAFGFTGNRISQKDNDIYNKNVNNLCLRHNIADRFYHVNKKDEIPERLKL